MFFTEKPRDLPFGEGLESCGSPNLSDKESADVRIEKSDGNKHSKNKMAFPELLQVFC